MKRLLALLLLVALSSCRFHDRLDLPVIPPDRQLDGLWKAISPDNTEQTLLIRSVGDGRYRLLAQNGSSRHVLDLHFSMLGKRRLAQARLMATVDAKGQATPSAEPAWLFLDFQRDGEQISLRWLQPVAGVSESMSRAQLTEAIRQALTGDPALGKPQIYKRTQTPESKRS